MKNDNLVALMVLLGQAEDSVYNNEVWQGDLLEFTGVKDGYFDQMNAEDLYWIDSLSIEVEEWAQWGCDVDAFVDSW